MKHFKEGEILYVKHKFMPSLSPRPVIFETINGVNGIRVDNHWFRFDYFFEVNYLC
jgi:hypothetical protein